MRRSLRIWGVAGLALLTFAPRSPAPLVYTPGQGWHYESASGEGSWRRGRAQDQMEAAQAAFDQKQFGTALKAAKHLVHQWPFSDYAPQAQYLLARCYEEKGQDERAFKAYQKIIQRYPKMDSYNEIVGRQKAIADRFLGGQWFKLFHVVPFFSSMDKTVLMYEQVIKNGPYSEVAPQAQLNIAAAYENKIGHDYAAAAKAYERAADRYSDRPEGKEALYRAGLAFNKQARTAEYDQSIAGQAITTFTDFTTLHPDDARAAEAQQIMDSLKTEQARGSYDIARYYERHNQWAAAKIYYNDVVQKDAKSKYAETARQRIEALNKRLQK